MQSHSRKNGYIALISVMLVSTVLFAMTVSLAQFGIVSRFNLLTFEQKHMSRALAESCVHYAEIFIANNSGYTFSTPTNFPVGDTSCTLALVTKTGSIHTIKTQGVVDHATTNLVVEITTDTGTVLSWREVSTF